MAVVLNAQTAGEVVRMVRRRFAWHYCYFSVVDCGVARVHFSSGCCVPERGTLVSYYAYCSASSVW